jgi:hypothetical protein
MSPVQLISMYIKGRREIKEGHLETIKTWIMYVCKSEGEWARQTI